MKNSKKSWSTFRDFARRTNKWSSTKRANTTFHRTCWLTKTWVIAGALSKLQTSLPSKPRNPLLQSSTLLWALESPSEAAPFLSQTMLLWATCDPRIKINNFTSDTTLNARSTRKMATAMDKSTCTPLRYKNLFLEIRNSKLLVRALELK